MPLGSSGMWAPRSRALCHPQRICASFQLWLWALSALCLHGQPPPSPPPPPRAAAWLMWMHILEKAEGKGGKKKPQSLKQSSKESASGEVIQSQFWISYTVNLFLLLWLYWMWGLLASTSSTVEGGISNEQTYKRVFRGWPWGSSRMDWGWNCGSVLMFLFCWFHFFHFFQVERWKRECCSPGGRLMGGEDSSSPLREY